MTFTIEPGDLSPEMKHAQAHFAAIVARNRGAHPPRVVIPCMEIASNPIILDLAAEGLELDEIMRAKGVLAVRKKRVVPPEELP